MPDSLSGRMEESVAVSEARSPSGKAKVCKTFIGGSIPPRASNFFVNIHFSRSCDSFRHLQGLPKQHRQKKPVLQRAQRAALPLSSHLRM